MVYSLIEAYEAMDNEIETGKTKFPEIEEALLGEIAGIYEDADAVCRLLRGETPEETWDLPEEYDELSKDEKLIKMREGILSEYDDNPMDLESIELLKTKAQEHNDKYKTLIFMNFVFSVFEASYLVTQELGNEELIEFYRKASETLAEANLTAGVENENE